MNKDFQTSKGTIYIRKLDLPKPGKEEIRNEIEALLQEKLGIHGLSIKNRLDGKPFISEHENLQISISHTEDAFAVYVSSGQPIGIDIEYRRDLIQKVKMRFMNAGDQALFPSPSLDELHLMWGAKEAIYKHFDGQFTELETQVTIRAIDLQNSVIFTDSIYGATACHYEIDSGLYIVWT